MQHEVTNGQDPICNIRLPTVGTYMQHEVIDDRVLICDMRLPMVRTLYVT